MSYRVMTVNEFNGRSVWLRVACDCGEQNHDLTLELAVDEECDDINLTLYSKMDTCFWWGIDGGIKYWFLRIKNALRVLFTGRLEVGSDMLIRGGKHIGSFIESLSEARDLLEKANKDVPR